MGNLFLIIFEFTITTQILTMEYLEYIDYITYICILLICSFSGDFFYVVELLKTFVSISGAHARSTYLVIDATTISKNSLSGIVF